MANGQNPFASMTPEQAGDIMRFLANQAREEVRGADEVPQEARSMWKRIPQNIGRVLTGGAVPVANRYHEANAITREELAADPEMQARFDAMSRQEQLLAQATKPGFFAGDEATFRGMIEEIAGLQQIIDLGPGHMATQGENVLHRAPFEGEVTGTTLGANDMFVGPQGQYLAGNQQPLVLDPGQHALERTGEPIGRAPFTPVVVGEGSALGDPNTLGIGPQNPFQPRVLKEGDVVEGPGGTFGPQVPYIKPSDKLSKFGRLKSEYESGLLSGDEYERALQAEESKKTSTVYQGLPGQMPGKKELEEQGDQSRRLPGPLAKSSALLQKLNVVSRRAVGPSAAVAEKVAPVLSFLSPGVGESFNEWATGLDMEELAALRVQGESLLASSIEIITGEEGARKSDAELRLTRAATRIREPLTDINAVRGAVSAILATHYINWDLALIRSGQTPKNDLSTTDGFGAEVGRLYDLGFRNHQLMADTVETMKLQREFLYESGAGGPGVAQ